MPTGANYNIILFKFHILTGTRGNNVTHGGVLFSKPSSRNGIALTRRFSECVQDAGSAKITYQVKEPLWEACQLEPLFHTE